MLPPTSASRHYRRIQRLQAVTIGSVRRAWRRLEPGDRLEQQYREDVGPKIAAVAVAAQMAATRESDAYVADVLNELAFGPPVESGVVNPRSLAGVAGDGRPVESLFATSVGRARAVASTIDAPERAATQQGLDEALKFIEMAAETLVADAARAAEAVAFAPREWVTGYVRMLNPPSCSRCAVLAGRFYLWNDGFERHPRCDCLHIPASEAVEGDYRLSPERYFDSLPTAAELDERYPDLTVEARREADLISQEDVFTVAGAKAIREPGVEINQVVNARRGMRKAQVYGHDVLITNEGTTRRGLAYGSLSRSRGRESDVRRSGERYFRTTAVRLMPESIFEIANGDRAEALRLLRLHGYLY